LGLALAGARPPGGQSGSFPSGRRGRRCIDTA
jgi:hypothetical protein